MPTSDSRTLEKRQYCYDVVYPRGIHGLGPGLVSLIKPILQSATREIVKVFIKTQKVILMLLFLIVLHPSANLVELEIL